MVGWYHHGVNFVIISVAVASKILGEASFLGCFCYSCSSGCHGEHKLRVILQKIVRLFRLFLPFPKVICCLRGITGKTSRWLLCFLLLLFLLQYALQILDSFLFSCIYCTCCMCFSNTEWIIVRFYCLPHFCLSFLVLCSHYACF